MFLRRGCRELACLTVAILAALLAGVTPQALHLAGRRGNLRVRRLGFQDRRRPRRVVPIGHRKGLWVRRWGPLVP